MKIMANRFLYSILFFSLLLPFPAAAQRKVTVFYTYRASAELPDSFAYSLLKPFVIMTGMESPAYDQKIVSFSRVGDTCVTACDYDVPDTACGFIFEGFGHETLVIPGDTIRVALRPKGDSLMREENVKYGIFGKYYLDFGGRNRFVYSLFDSLQYFGGDLRRIHSYLGNYDALDRYYEAATNHYKDRERFLEEYCTRHAVPDSYKRMASSEVYSVYLFDLFMPTFDDANRRDRLSRFSEKDDSVNVFKSDSGTIRMYDLVKGKCPGRMKDYLLGYLLKSFASVRNIKFN
jgi:hypothetical protein